MTGFGKAIVECGNKKIVVEVKSLNSKQLDVNLRLPNLYKEKDIEIRNIIKTFLERGKVDMTITFDEMETERAVSVNQAVVMQYFQKLFGAHIPLQILRLPISRLCQAVKNNNSQRKIHKHRAH